MAELENALRRFGLTLLALGASRRDHRHHPAALPHHRRPDGAGDHPAARVRPDRRLVQPNYFFLADQRAEPASRGDPAQQGDAAQYILQKLKLPDVHRLVRGTNVPIAVIDSEIDAAHPDLQGVIAQRFSAVGAPETPHSHGTGMAGAIASRLRVIGVAPSSRLFAVHAFSTKAAKRREHHVQHPQGHRLVGEPGRAHHQYELRRPEGPLARARAQGGLRQRHRADRRRRQCRAEIAAALSRRRPQRDRGDGDRRRRQAVRRRQSRKIRRGGGARRRHPGAGARRQLPADHGDIGRGRRGERHRGAPARAQSAAHARRHQAHPHEQRKTARRPATATTISARAWSTRCARCSRPIRAPRVRHRRGDRLTSSGTTPSASRAHRSQMAYPPAWRRLYLYGLAWRWR